MTEPDPATRLELIPFAALLGIELVQADRDLVVGRLAWAPERCTTGGVTNGRR